MAKERIAYIDFMKGLCILLIVMGHVEGFSYDSIMPGLNYALKSFRIPMYFFLSGLFFKTYGEFSEFLRKKVNNLIITLLFFHFVCSFLRIPLVAVVHHYRPDIDISFPISSIIPPFFGRLWYSAGALWFLVALFGVNMLYYLIQSSFGKLGRVLAVLCFSILGYILMKYKIELPFEFDISLVALPFFMLGVIVKELGLLKASRYDKYGMLIIVPSSFFVYYFSADINLLYQGVPNYFMLYLIPFIAILSLFWFCKNLKYVPLICHYGRYSIILLGTHQILIGYIWAFLHGFIDVQSNYMVLITIALVLLIELAIIKILVRYFPRFTAQKDFFLPGWKISE